jgi:hypothetical protein
MWAKYGSTKLVEDERVINALVYWKIWRYGLHMPDFMLPNPPANR